MEVVVDQRVLQRDLGERFHFDCRAAASALALNRNSDGYAASKKVLTQSDWQGIRAENWMERREQEAAKQEKARQEARELHRKPPEFLVRAERQR